MGSSDLFSTQQCMWKGLEKQGGIWQSAQGEGTCTHLNLSTFEIIHIKLFEKGNSSVIAFIIHISMLLFIYKLNYDDSIY